MNFTFKITCTDEKGLVYRISEVLLENGLNIIKNDEFVDSKKSLFFMRTEVEGIADPNKVIARLKDQIGNCEIELSSNKPKDVVVFVTREHHCLSDLLIRNQFKDLNFNILAVIGNYENLRELTEKFQIPFHYISTENITRDEHENLIKETLQNYEFDYVVLAKFMRILSSDFVSNFKGKIINIHHSFLPAFIGANPYKQAFERGVKIIGATAHFVTNDLDEGPIIYQDIIKVTHSKTAKDLAKLGRDVEKNVLANALKLVFEDKVFIDGNKTIIFE
ncbi:formyltetrahydrofolate deformylase [Epilithonimonas lactis]|uniref:Formyltetrahydrofolate deformylase n=1 Tax=Epilithonimonas lactis TaxID=421072 RepID=A0A085BJV5_9FLAO|nr:formyltetrahydrofolate deformylase [Epilithonimonas lactis]KFC22750.1 formyltetrahydrofolate deformylase [Epilithonimonas lactis]SEQ86182.1 formyltetrahydrofolate deformylase [Epilithonimonas lactis]